MIRKITMIIFIIISFNNAHARDIEKVDVKYCENAMKSGGTVAYGATEQGHIRLILLYDDGIYRYTINKHFASCANIDGKIHLK